jgi:aminoglycoside phosphotransferase (APT) family kinase protein
MTQSAGWPSPHAVTAAFGIDGRAGPLVPVPGAWSNRVFRLVVGAEPYAVKELLNPWADPRWLDWVHAAYRFERRAIAAGVAAPAPIANPSDGGCVAWVERDGHGPLASVRVHRWVEGRSPGVGPVDLTVARWAGHALATLHRLGVRPEDRTIFPVPDKTTRDHWPRLVEAAEHAGATWAPHLSEATGYVDTIADLVRAGGQLPHEEVMTHGDLDQKNIILGRSGSAVCDWDVAAPWVPRRELADTALSLAAWEQFDVAREVVRSYRRAGGADTRIEPPDLGEPLMTGVDWIAFNVERALGLRAALPSDIARAGRLVPNLLHALLGRVEIALRATQLLAL